MARDIVLDAAERLLERGEAAEFSMRALAAEAGVGFATPFNHFGNKTAIMQALSARLIGRMAAAFEKAAPAEEALRRVLAMGAISTALLLEKPAVHKAVVGSLGAPSGSPGVVRQQSRDLWAMALGAGEGLVPGRLALAQLLPDQLAFTFRGCLSFWIAGELADSALEPAFRRGASALFLGFLPPESAEALRAEIGGASFS